MVTLIQDVVQGYNNWILNDPYADPRTTKYFLVSNPLALVSLLIIYLYFCTKWGPKWMEGRKPFELTNILIIYNAFQVLFSCYMAIEGTAVWWNFKTFWCQLQDFSDSPEAIRMMNLIWLYFLAKITELLDTVLFVLRKKNNQISFLHLYHHTVMPLVTWIGIRYLGGGHSTLFGVLNCYVHVAMYSYYLIAALGPEYQKYLWWKRHLTEMQLIQFITVFIHNVISLSTSCAFPMWIRVSKLMLVSVFIFLFGNFYLKTYILPKNLPKKNIMKKD